MPDTTLPNDKSIQELVTLGLTRAEIKTAGNTPFVVIPNDHKVVPLREYIYNEHAEHPHRKIGTVKVLDAPSFCEYYTKFFDDFSRVFADETTGKVLAVLDYHGAGENAPRWCQHRIDLTLRKSKEWEIWTKANAHKVTQTEFAEFMENNATDIVDPSSAAMLDVARDLSAKTEVDFSSAQRLADGSVKFKYTEEVRATVGAGELAVPERFTISIPVYIGMERITLTARLRFRIASGKLTFWYDLLRPDTFERQAFLNARQSIAETLGITIINGTPA